MTAKILIVEDDDDLRYGLCRRLGILGYAVVTAQDGIGAVSVALRERPDAVLLDIGLPGGDGVSVLERYANLAALAQTPVVVLSGRDPAVTEPVVQRHRVAAYLRKPVDNDALAAALRDAVRAPAPDVRPPALAAAPADGSPPSSWFG